MISDNRLTFSGSLTFNISKALITETKHQQYNIHLLLPSTTDPTAPDFLVVVFLLWRICSDKFGMYRLKQPSGWDFSYILPILLAPSLCICAWASSESLWRTVLSISRWSIIHSLHTLMIIVFTKIWILRQLQRDIFSLCVVKSHNSFVGLRILWAEGDHNIFIIILNI